MKKINTYIIEKLHINKDTKVVNSVYELTRDICFLCNIGNSIDFDDKKQEIKSKPLIINAISRWIEDNNIKNIIPIIQREEVLHELHLDSDEGLFVIDYDKYHDYIKKIEKTPLVLYKPSDSENYTMITNKYDRNVIVIGKDWCNDSLKCVLFVGTK